MRIFPDRAFSSSSFFRRISSEMAVWMASVLDLAPVTSISSLTRRSSRLIVVRIMYALPICLHYTPAQDVGIVVVEVPEQALGDAQPRPEPPQVKGRRGGGPRGAEGRPRCPRRAPPRGRRPADRWSWISADPHAGTVPAAFQPCQ